MSSQTVWLPTALYTALIRWQMDDFTAIGFVNAIFGDKAESQIRHSAPDLGINLPIALTQYLQNDLLVSC